MKKVLPARLGALFLCLVGCLPNSLQVWEGDLSIPGSAPPSALRRIVAIEGDLIVTGAAQGELDLPSLRTVAGDVVIRTSARLETFAGLERLAWVGGDLIVEENPRLVHLVGLGSLAYVGGDVRIRKNATLESVDGLDRLAVIGGSLELAENPALASLARLRRLQSIQGGIVLRTQPALPSLEGLEPADLRGAVVVVDAPSLPEKEIEAWRVRLEEKGGTGRRRDEPDGIPSVGGSGANEPLGDLQPGFGLAPSRGLIVGRRDGPEVVFSEAPEVKGALRVEQVDDVARRHRNQIRFCYERELVRARELPPPLAATNDYLRGGMVTVGWTIEDSGDTADIRIIEEGFSDGKAARCIQQRIRRWRFPPPEGGGTTDVAFTWKFQAPKQEGAKR